MTTELLIVGLGGSLARVSRSRAALEVALEGAASAGAETALLDLRELALPMYDPDDEELTPAVARLTELCDRADGMMWSSPLYQGTISGSFKNALDWLHVLGSREPPFLHDKVVGLISAAGGTHGLQAINTMEFSRAVRSVRGPFRTSFPSPRPFGSSSPTARSRTRASSCSCGRWGRKSFASPSASRPNRHFTTRRNATRPQSASRLLFSRRRSREALA